MIAGAAAGLLGYLTSFTHRPLPASRIDHDHAWGWGIAARPRRRTAPGWLTGRGRRPARACAMWKLLGVFSLRPLRHHRLRLIRWSCCFLVLLVGAPADPFGPSVLPLPRNSGRRTPPGMPAIGAPRRRAYPARCIRSPLLMGRRSRGRSLAQTTETVLAPRRWASKRSADVPGHPHSSAAPAGFYGGIVGARFIYMVARDQFFRIKSAIFGTSGSGRCWSPS